MDATELLSTYRVTPVVVIERPEIAVPLARTLLTAGIGVIEITLRTADALAAIRAVADEVPEILVGAGSVCWPDQVDAVIEAGARFAISPGSTPALIAAVGDAELPFVPGASTPSEILALLAQGYRLQKFFPAEAAGGLSMLKSVAGPIPGVSFLPTGGISRQLASAYLGLPNVVGVGGSWIVPTDLLTAQNFDEIGRLAGEAALL